MTIASAEATSDIPIEQHMKRMKKKGICGFLRKTWNKRPLTCGKKTKVRPIVPPLQPDTYLSNPDRTCFLSASNRPDSAQAVFEPLLITDLSWPQQTPDKDVSEERPVRDSTLFGQTSEEQHTKKKKSGFFSRTWKGLKRPFARSHKTTVRPIVPPLLPDESNPDLTSVPGASNLKHSPDGKQVAAEPLLITDLSWPEQTRDSTVLDVFEEILDRASTLPGQIPESLDASDITSPTSSSPAKVGTTKSSAEAIESTGLENQNGSKATPTYTVENTPKEQHIKKKRAGICGFFRRTWKALKRPFSRSYKTRVMPIVPPLLPDKSNPDTDPAFPEEMCVSGPRSNPEVTSDSDTIPGHLCFNPTDGNIDSYYTVGEMLGLGSYGTVFEATRKSDGQKVAIKVIRKWMNHQYLFLPGHSIPVLSEVALMVTMRRPPVNSLVIQMFEWFESPQSIKIIMEYPQQSISLSKYLQKHSILRESTARILISQAVLALQDCIDHGVFHCDVHPGNLLVNPDTFEVKLIDFGCGLLVSTAGYNRSQYRGAPNYCPPEISSEPLFHAVPTNVWQLGLILFDMVNGYLPENAAEEDLLMDSDLSEDCHDVIRWFLTPDPSKRPGLLEILGHKWFSHINLEIDTNTACLENIGFSTLRNGLPWWTI